MKINCLRENLKSGLDTVGQAATGRPTLPILSSVLLRADRGGLTMTASNLEQSIAHLINGRCEVEGAIAAPYKLFASIIDALPKDCLVGLSVSGHLLEIVTEHSSAHINCQDSKDFPPIPDCSGGQVITIPSSELKRAIDLTVFGVAAEMGRPALCGVSIRTAGDGLQFASADGYRLAVFTVTTPTEAVNLIVPARTMMIVGKLCKATNGDDDPEVIIQLGKPGKNGDIHAMKFIVGRTGIVSQLINGTFPDYERLIPDDFKTTATIGLDDFLRAVRFADTTTDDVNHQVRLEMDGDKMTVSGGKGNEIGDSTTSLPVSLAGEQSARIAVNSNYLADVLSAFRGLPVSGVTFAVTSPSSPCVVRPVGIDGYTHVMMPLYVGWESVGEEVDGDDTL